jgi:hypothetical protein
MHPKTILRRSPHPLARSADPIKTTAIQICLTISIHRVKVILPLGRMEIVEVCESHLQMHVLVKNVAPHREREQPQCPRKVRIHLMSMTTIVGPVVKGGRILTITALDMMTNTHTITTSKTGAAGEIHTSVHPVVNHLEHQTIHRVMISLTTVGQVEGISKDSLQMTTHFKMMKKNYMNNIKMIVSINSHLFMQSIRPRSMVSLILHLWLK